MTARARTRGLDHARLAVLAEPTRAMIVEALAEEELCTCHLVEITGAGQSNVSNHLKVLRDAGLVEAEPHGRYTYYRLSAPALLSLAEQVFGLAAAAAGHGSRRRACD